MITFKQFLAELFDSTTDYRVVADTEKNFITESEIGGRVIKFTATLISGSWLIFFVEKDPSGQSRYDTTEQTGRGAEIAVFAFVTKSLKNFVTKRKPDKMEFAAADEGRTTLYRRMLKRLSGYDFEEKRTKGQTYVGFKIFKKN